jgi:D-alanyl-D-alanine carboxypeptidase
MSNPTINTLAIAVRDNWSTAITKLLYDLRVPGYVCLLCCVPQLTLLADPLHYNSNCLNSGVVDVETPDGIYLQPFGTGTYEYTVPKPLPGAGIETGQHFRIGSNTKTMTGTIIVWMCQQQMIHLSDPITKHIYPPLLTPVPIPLGDEITIEMLLLMRSGLYNYSDTIALNRSLDVDPSKEWTPFQLLELAFIPDTDNPDKKSYFSPGTAYKYSNTNTILLGMVIEQVMNKPLRDVYTELLFRPNDLVDTMLPPSNDTAFMAPHPPGYVASIQCTQCVVMIVLLV